MAKAGNNRKRVVAAAAAEEEDCGSKSDKGLGWCLKVEGSHSKLVNWSRGEGFGSISIYIESQIFPTSIAVSPARIAKEYWLPNSPNWDIIQFLCMLSSTWNTHTHTRSCPGDKILTWRQNCFVPLCPGQNNFVPAVYIVRPLEWDCNCLSGHSWILFWLRRTD